MRNILESDYTFGIAGIVDPDQRLGESVDASRRMCGFLRHRAVEGEWHFDNNTVTMGMRRLEITDVQERHQRYKMRTGRSGGYEMERLNIIGSFLRISRNAVIAWQTSPTTGSSKMRGRIPKNALTDLSINDDGECHDGVKKWG